MNLAYLEGLIGADAVTAAWTLAKILAPGLRLAFVVAPPELLRHLAMERALVDRQGDDLTLETKQEVSAPEEEKVAAETPAAAQALTQTASDLRRSLESQGLQIASLDVHVAGDGPASNGERRQASDLAQAMGTTDRATSEEDVVDITTELHLVPLGTQVDVLA